MLAVNLLQSVAQSAMIVGQMRLIEIRDEFTDYIVKYRPLHLTESKRRKKFARTLML